MYYPDKKTLRILRSQYDTIPVYAKLPYDGKDILEIYQAFHGPYAFLLESETQMYNGHYSIIGLPCDHRFLYDGMHSYDIHEDKKIQLHGHPMKHLEAMLEKKSPVYPDIPVFTGGAIGHFNYDIAGLYENISNHEQESLYLPMMHFGFVNACIVIDHTQKTVYFIIHADADSCLEKYDTICENLKQMITRYQQSTPYTILKDTKHRAFQTSHDKESFMHMVEKAKDYIYEGDIFQVVLSQRMECDYDEDPLSAYAKLRTMGSSPYMYYLDFDSYVIAGASPELLLQGRKDLITTKPIAGTRKRGKGTKQDQQLMKELIHDPKENAEHMMLVDLGRNDIGKVSKSGSVEVTSLKQIEYYPSVMHLCSEVSGTLKDEMSVFDAFASVLPAGTLSGAPKIKAMQIINELEAIQREIYGGAIGFLGYNQLFDTCITIRTILFHKQKAYIQAGAGIVKDSQPDKEYEETFHKATSLLHALGCEVAL